jgi:hypothetical protein
MDRLKAMVRSALDDRSPRFVLATIALGVAVALLAGFAIGYKVDNSSGGGKAAKKTATKKTNKNGKGTKGNKSVGLKEGVPFVGTVNAVKARKLNVTDLDANKKRSLTVGAKTHIYGVKTATASDIKVGDRVLCQPSCDGTTATTAVEIVVLPGKAQVGTEVTAVKSGSMTLKSVGGTPQVTTTGAVVRKTHAGKRKGIAKGDKVYVRYFVVRARRTQATDVVVLPKDSKFQ